MINIMIDFFDPQMWVAYHQQNTQQQWTVSLKNLKWNKLS